MIVAVQFHPHVKVLRERIAGKKLGSEETLAVAQQKNLVAAGKLANGK